MTIWKYIKASTFFRDYPTGIKSVDKKLRGYNGKGDPVFFSKEEKRRINEAMQKMFNEHKLK